MQLYSRRAPPFSNRKQIIVCVGDNPAGLNLKRTFIDDRDPRDPTRTPTSEVGVRREGSEDGAALRRERETQPEIQHTRDATVKVV